MFFFSVQTRRLQESFEGSYSSLAYSSGVLSRVIASYCSRQWETHAFSDFGGKMGFWGDNFGSRHARRSSKGSIDAEDYLFSTKRFSQNFGPLDWRPRLIKIGQKNENTPLCEPVSGEPLTQIKNCCLIKPRRFAASVEGLNNSLAIAAGEYNKKSTRQSIGARGR